jgi:hypothetical protein
MDDVETELVGTFVRTAHAERRRPPLSIMMIGE